MATKPSYEELERRVTELTKEVSEHKRLNDRFREKELRFTTTQQVGRIGSWDRNLKTGEVYWSDQNYRIWGYEPRKVTPSFELVKSLIHPDDLQEFLKVRDAALYQKEPYYMTFGHYKNILHLK